MADKIVDRHVPLKDLLRFAEQLSNHLNLRRSRYLLSIGNPFKHKTARIPTLISPPSATFSVRSIVPLTTNALGNVSFAYSPFFLSTSALSYTSFAINNNAGLTGAGSSNFYICTAIGQQLPADFYVRYRLVSAGLRLYCYPSSNNDNGIAVISTTFETLNYNTVTLNMTNAAQFGDFNQIENGWYKQTTTVASRQVQEHAYIPLDESFYDYTVVGVDKPGFAWVGYISGAAPSATIARLELIANYEAMLDNQYADYLPSDVAFDEMEPKNIAMFINRAKKLDELSPKTINDLLQQENQAINPEDIIELPSPPKSQKRIEAEMREAKDDLLQTMKDFFPEVPKKAKETFLTTVMDLISPISSGIIQHIAGQYMPYLPFK